MKKKIHYTTGTNRRVLTPEGTLEAVGFEIAPWKKKTAQQIGWGKFQPADRVRTIMFMRYAFLEMVREMELKERWRHSGRRKIEVLKDLSGLPFEEFQKSGMSAEQTRSFILNTKRRFKVELEPLRLSLNEWAERWGLNASWCLNVAIDTLEMWRNHDELIRSLPGEIPKELELLVKQRDYKAQIGEGEESPLKPFNPKSDPPTWAHSFFLDEESRTLLKEKIVWKIPFEWLPPFFAHMEMRKSYEKYARTTLLQHLSTNPFTARLDVKTRRSIVNDSMKQIEMYCDRVMKFYRRQKDETGAPKWKEVENSPDLARDLRWLIENQVRGRSALQIAVSVDMGSSNVNNAINKLHSIIGLPARKGSWSKRVTKEERITAKRRKE